MPCPHCTEAETVEQRRPTALGYRTFRCGRCRRVFNERTGTPYNHLQYPTDLVLLVVVWRLCYKLSLSAAFRELYFSLAPRRGSEGARR